MGLLSFLFGSKPQPQQPAQQGGGLLAVPSGNQQKAYQDYVIDTQSQGKAPMSYTDFCKQQAMQQPKPAQ